MSRIEKPCKFYKPWQILFGFCVEVGIQVYCHLRALKAFKLPYFSSFIQELDTN